MAKKKQGNKTSNSSIPNDTLVPIDIDEQLAIDKIFKLLDSTFNVDFSHYRHTTILRRMSRRMTLNKKNTYSDYFEYIKKSLSEINKLYDDLLLSFTEFFRDEHAFEILETKVFPALAEGRTVRTPIRIWVPGCSTGEEVYSLAICLYEFLEKNKSKASVQFFGTDLTEKNIKRARMAVYSDKIEKNISKKRLNKFFDQTPQGYKVVKYIREMCVFAKQDIACDPPFPKIDLISCRNVLIYLDMELQERVIPLFHFSLNSNGFLLLGSSETMGQFSQFFEVVDNKVNLYSKRDMEVKPEYEFPYNKQVNKFKKISGTHVNKLKSKINNLELANQINNVLIETYAPPGVLIDKNMQILQFTGQAFSFLKPENGQASLKLTRMIGEGLMPDLYVLIEEAKKKNRKIKREEITFIQDGVSKLIDITIIPVSERESDLTYFLILFEENAKSVSTDSVSFLFDKQEKDEVLKLRAEIKSTKESLRAIVEEKDEVNQSLWTSNEEVLSTNEELQSVNEEMEAAKEELEASNEELIALNEELQKKNIELIKSTEYSEKLVQVLKKKETVLKESENNLRALFNAMTDVVFELDYDGMYINIASSSPELMYKPSKEIVGKKLHDVFPKNKADEFLKFIRKTLDENQTNTIEYSLSINNKIMWFEGRATPKSENTVLYIGRDITLQKQREAEKINLEKQLRHTQKLETIGTLAGGIAHDFNNILAPIMGYTEMAMLKLIKTEPLYRNLQNVLNGAHRAKELVEQILLFSKQNEKKRTHIRLQTLIKEALKLLRPSIPSTIEIRKNIDSRCPKILADSTQIHQVIVNLCTNAWQSMEAKGGVLSIELKKTKVDNVLAKLYPYLVEADYACLSIVDTGVGMDANIMERMFEPFYTTKSVDKGTGLGLSVVHGIVHSHNGEIIVDSELKKGTKIRIYLPLAGSSDLLAEPKTEEIIRGVEYIMIVDDEPSILEMLKDMLEHFGYKTETFKTAIDAIKAFNQAPNKFDLVLTDLTMPKITGLELADRLHQIIPDFPVIIMTGFGDNIAEVTKERYSIKRTICKPIIIKELTGSIRDILDNK